MRAIRRTAAIPAAMVVCALAVSAPAGVVNLGAGWQASWDPALDGLVDVMATGVVGDALFIQKFADYRQEPVGEELDIPSIRIQFQQVAYPAATHIVIDDEILINNNGVVWTDFHFKLVDTTGGTLFNPAQTAGSGGAGPIGWTIDPFELAQFTTQQQLDVWGGDVPNGATWFPGNGASDGQLWIDVTPGPNNSGSFVLLEKPTTTGVPEPATLGLLCLGGLALVRRRRKA